MEETSEKRKPYIANTTWTVFRCIITYLKESVK